MSHFVLIVELQVKPERLDKFNRIIAVNAQASVKGEPGCRQFDVLHNQDDPRSMTFTIAPRRSRSTWA